MPFNDTVKLSFASFQKHVNLGGETSRTLSDHGQLCRLELLPSGMVRVTKQSGTFYVAAAVIESVEAAPDRREGGASFNASVDDIVEEATPGPEKADALREKAAKATKTRDGGKYTNSEPPMSRADEILKEFGGK